MIYFNYDFSRVQADSYLKENYGYGIDFFRSSIFIINGYWPSGYDMFGRKKLSLRRFTKQQIKRLESLKRKTLNNIVTIEYHNSNFSSISPRPLKKSQFKIYEEFIINRYKLNPFFSEINKEITACKKALDFMDIKIPAATTELKEMQKSLSHSEKKGRPLLLIYKVSSVWALIIKHKNTEKANWTDICYLLFWLNENEFKNTTLNFEKKGKIPDISSLEREYHRIKRIYGKEFLEELRNKLIIGSKGKMGNGIEVGEA